MTPTPSSKVHVANPSYTPLPPDPDGYSSFESFYPYYLGEHAHAVCRKLHLVGTTISSLVLIRVIASAVPKILDATDFFRLSSAVQANVKKLRLNAPAWKYLLGGVTQAYFLAWVGHFFFERNKPATFKYPLYSLMGDMKMLSEVITLKRSP